MLLPVADVDPVLEVELLPLLSSWEVTAEEPVLEVEEPVCETEEEEPVLETAEELVRLADEELPDVPTVTEGLVVEEEVPGECVVEVPLTLEDVEDEPLTEVDPPVVVLGAAGVVFFTVEEDLDKLLLLEDLEEEPLEEDELLEDDEEDEDFPDELP